MNSQHPLPDEEPPRTLSDLEVSSPRKKAVGAEAVFSSLQHIEGEAGFARGTRALLDMNQKGGFDCPSCAWPDPDDERSRFEFCENGAKAIATEATRKKVTPKFFGKHSVAELAERPDVWLNAAGRLTDPMLLEPGATHYRPVAWEEAFGLIAEELHALDHPDEAIFYTSGRTSNEAAFLYQLFVRQFGTNNLPDCSNMCHESSGAALTQTIGIGKGTVTLEEIETTDCLLIMGQNPGTNHPRMLTSLEKAVKNGCTIISVNPMEETGLRAFAHPQKVSGLLGKSTPLAKLHLPVRLNGDLPFLKGLLKCALASEVLDRGFIAEETTGFEAMRDALDAVGWDAIEEQSGLTRGQIETAADIFLHAGEAITCWAMGLTQHHNAVETIREIVNLHLLTGKIGRPRSGLCPVRGHSNVQGDRTMGIWEKMPAAFHDRLDAEFGFRSPRNVGWDTVESIEAMHSGRGKIFFGLGGNFLSAAPDTRFTAEALRRCRLTVHVSTKLHRGHLVTGERALILPCLARSERDEQRAGRQFVTVENSMGIVHGSTGKLKPISPNLLSEPAIVCRLARAVLGPENRVPWEEFEADYDAIRDRIERVVPGFDDYNQRARRPGGFYLPNPVKQRRFRTASGKAEFTVNPLDPIRLEPDQLLLQTLRSHDQFNTTVYGLNDRYRGIHGERRVIFLNPDDLADRGIAPQELVDITSHFQGETRTAECFRAIPYAMPRGCAAAYFPEANVLVPIGSRARTSQTPTSKSIVIRIERRT